MGYAALKSLIIGSVRGATPVRYPDDGFTAIEDDSGPVPRLEDFTAMVSLRRFDVRIEEAPRDDGEAGAGQLRVRTRMAVRLAYRTDGDYGDTESIIAEDVACMVNVLVNMPTVAGWAAAGGCSVTPPGIPTTEPVFESLDGRQIGTIVKVPFDMLYVEAR